MPIPPWPSAPRALARGRRGRARSLTFLLFIAALGALLTACSARGEFASPTPTPLPSATPLGAQIAYVSGDGLSTIRMVNEFALHDVSISRPATARSGYPRWSPDGEQIAFVAPREGQLEIFVMKADGTQLRRITNDPGADGLP
ncbi:MAG: PD40 domain-containing protein, partial [Chloroflexi bacterium]|nr:PD40 domain-containing protein [Chloroflexota bacterium]